MLNVSAEWRRSVIIDEDRQYLGFADIITTNKENILTDNTKYWENGFSIEDSTSEENIFSIGSLIAGKLTLSLNNIYEEYSRYDFTDAKVTARIGKQLESGLEKIKVGEFTVNETSYDGSIIRLTCLDNVSKFNKSYGESTLSYPATAYEIVRNACLDCEVPFAMAKFDNSDFIVDEKPEDQLTYGQVLAYVLQLCGSWGKCNSDGELIIGWYKEITEQHYNGGTFLTDTTPYSDGAVLNGGNFINYSSGDSADGSTFEAFKEYHVLFGASSLNIYTDDVVITGVKIKVTSKEEKEDDYEYLAGQEGYIVSIADNPLITKDKAKSVADFIYQKIVGMRFRPFDGTFLSDPTIEAGDSAVISDRKDNLYNSFISNRTFSIGTYMSLSCDAESPARNSADRYSSETKALVKARKVAKTQISAYDIQMQLLTRLMAQSFGLFKTEQVQEDGSVIYIMHNKADLSSSQIQWKMTANGMAVSSDYGKTWNAGIDKDGNAIFNIMSAIGINFDWAHGGTLTLGGENNTNGVQYVKDAKGNTLITLDNKGITLADSVMILWKNISNATKEVTQITKDTVTAPFVKGLNLKVGNEIQMGENATINWDKVIGATEKTTQITKDTVTTQFVNALKVKAGSVDAENITGTTIIGKTFSTNADKKPGDDNEGIHLNEGGFFDIAWQQNGILCHFELYDDALKVTAGDSVIFEIKFDGEQGYVSMPRGEVSYADNASHASTADSAENASHASTADSAENANHATYAKYLEGKPNLDVGNIGAYGITCNALTSINDITCNALTSINDISAGASDEVGEKRVYAANLAGNVYIYANGSGQRGMYTTAGPGASKRIVTIDSSGTVSVNTSDSRLKNDLGLLKDKISKDVLNVPIHLFTYKSDEKEIEQSGIMAQELRDILLSNGIKKNVIISMDKAGSTDAYFDLTIPEDEVTYSVDYTKLIPYLIKGWQIHEQQINVLQEQVNKLNSMMQTILGSESEE